MKPLDLIFPDPQRCLFCGRPFQPRSWGICPECLAALKDGDGRQPLPMAYGDGAAAFRYQGAARSCLLALKFQGETWRAPMMAQWMAYAAQAMEPEAVAAVPIHPLRRMARGYAQCVLLAKGVAAALALPYEGEALRRRRHAPPLYTLQADDHARAVAGRFSAGKAADRLRGKHVLLVDDVCTTGSTLNECARILVQAGVSRVSAVCFAAASGAYPVEGPF